MTRQEKVSLAMARIAEAWGCTPDVFSARENVFLPSDNRFFEVLSFGGCAAFRLDPSLHGAFVARFSDMESSRILDLDILFEIEALLRGHNHKLCGEHTRYLYLDTARVLPRPEGFRYELLDDEAVRSLYAHKGFDNALNYSKDVIALTAYDGDTIAAMAAADDHLSPMWQIGIDTVDAYRGRGLAAYLVKTLADAIEARGKIAYYTTWSGNIASTRVALACGFLPAWVGYYAEKIDS